MREELVEVLERGKGSATQMRRLIDHHQHHDHDELMKGKFNAHSLEVLNSFASALSMLHKNCLSLDHHHHHYHQVGLKRSNPTPTHHHDFKSKVFEDWEVPNSPKDARGYYKRRKNSHEQSMEIETINTDDGFAWRKYGQKSIQYTKHPRNYYRCTHKIEQGCQATKQVQQISENPPKFKIIYHGHHTCQNPLKIPSTYLDLIDDDQHSSSIFLSFEKSNNSKHSYGLNPFVFPSPSPLSSSPSTAAAATTKTTSSSSLSKVKQDEYNFIQREIPSESSDLVSNTSDITTTTTLVVSDDLVSLPEVYSAVLSPYGVEEDYRSNIMAESFDFNEVFQDLICDRL